MSPKNALPNRPPDNTLPNLQQSIASPRSISVENAKEEREALQEEIALQKQVEANTETLREIEKTVFSDYDHLMEIKNTNAEFPVTYEREGVKILQETILQGNDLERFYINFRLNDLGRANGRPRNSLAPKFANRWEEVKNQNLSYNEKTVEGLLILKKMAEAETEAEPKKWRFDQHLEKRSVKFAKHLPLRSDKTIGSYEFFAVLKHNGKYHVGVNNHPYFTFSDETVKEVGEGNNVELRIYRLPKMWEHHLERTLDLFGTREKLL